MTSTRMQIVFASLLGALLFGEAPDALSAAGRELVLAGAWLAGRRAPEAPPSLHRDTRLG